MTLDTIDKSLLNALQGDSKQTTKALSLKLNLSVTAVYERIKKLEREGYIKDYVALLDPEQLDAKLIVFCQVSLSQHTEKIVSAFERDILNFPEVVSCFHISGDNDYLIKVMVSNMKAFRQFMVKKLTTLDYLGSTRSSFVMSTIKDTTAIPIK